MKKMREGVCIVLLLMVVLVFFGAYCPLEEIVGIPCPGCNMFTALYWFLHGNFKLATYYHPALWGCIGYVLILFLLWLKYKEKLFQTSAFRLCSLGMVVILLIVYIIRMVLIFPQAPMQFNQEAILIRLFRLL